MISRRTILASSGGLALVGTSAAYFSYRSMGSMAEYEASAALTREELKKMPYTLDLIRYATLAANSHNSQPWRFKVTNTGIDILPDMTRKLSAVDPDNHHLFASLGCAAENFAIASAMRSMPGTLNFALENYGGVHFERGGGSVAEPALFAAIPKRQFTRGDYIGKPVNAADLATLMATASVPDVDVILITDRPQLNQIRNLVVAANSAQMGDEAFVRELKAWMRFNPTQALEHGDGLFSATSGNLTLPSWLGPTMFDLAFKADKENDRYARQIATSAGIAVFVAQGEGPEHWVQAGRTCQRFALAATSLGLKHAFLNQPIEVARFRPELAALIGMPGRRPDIVMRFGVGPVLPYSVRRPVAAVLV